MQCFPEAAEFVEITQKFRRSKSFKVADFGINRKLIYEFMLVILAYIYTLTCLLSCTVSEIQHSMSEIAIIWLPLRGV